MGTRCPGFQDEPLGRPDGPREGLAVQSARAGRVPGRTAPPPPHPTASMFLEPALGPIVRQGPRPPLPRRKWLAGSFGSLGRRRPGPFQPSDPHIPFGEMGPPTPFGGRREGAETGAPKACRRLFRGAAHALPGLCSGTAMGCFRVERKEKPIRKRKTSRSGDPFKLSSCCSRGPRSVSVSGVDTIWFYERTLVKGLLKT